MDDFLLSFSNIWVLKGQLWLIAMYVSRRHTYSSMSPAKVVQIMGVDYVMLGEFVGWQRKLRWGHPARRTC